MSYRIFIVDDHALTREGYTALISRQADLDLCGEATTAQEALERIPAAEPDLVIVDVSLRGMSGLELVKRLQAQWPGLLSLVVSLHDEALYAERAMRAGARGYVMKEADMTAILQAMRTVLEGRFYLSPQMSERVMTTFLKADHEPVATRTPVDELTDRELEVFEHLGRGRSSREIAEALLISPKTVGTYRSRIKQKLALGSSSELARRAALWVAGETPELIAAHDRQQAPGARARRPAGFNGTRQFREGSPEASNVE